MVYSLWLMPGARQDIARILADAPPDKRPRLRRTFTELYSEIRADGPMKGLPAPFNQHLRRLTDEDRMVAAVFDTSNAELDRFVRVLHFIKVAPEEAA